MGRQEQYHDLIRVVNENKGIIYKISNVYCHDKEDQKDLIQEIVIQIWKSLERYNVQFRMSTWIYRIALNVAITHFRKNKIRKDKTQPLAKDILHVADESEPSDDEDNIQLLKQFISELKELDKALMILYLESKSYKDVADILGISETNVATKLSRIKKQLRQRFAIYNTNHYDKK